MPSPNRMSRRLDRSDEITRGHGARLHERGRTSGSTNIRGPLLSLAGTPFYWKVIRHVALCV
jgi:hypothetical protein